MREKKWGNAYRTTVICIDSFSQGVLSGRLCNPALEDGKEDFCGVLELLRKVDAMLDGMEYPQSFTARRSFQPPENWTVASGQPSPIRHGERATFAVRIMFRRNASWQGSVTWLEGDQQENFRSVLELLLLIDSALQMNNGSQ